MPTSHARRSVLRAVLTAAVLVGFGLAPAGCKPLSSLACDHAEALCGHVDLAACDATLDLVPPRVRDELLECTTQARDCAEATSCFARYQLPLPRVTVVVQPQQRARK